MTPGKQGASDVGEPVTQLQFFTAMRELDDKLQDYHRRQREHIDKRIDDMHDAFRTHELEDRTVADRVTSIEKQREAESNAIAKLSAMTSAIVTAVLYAGAAIAKKIAGS